jgi:hypothetical protein
MCKHLAGWAIVSLATAFGVSTARSATINITFGSTALTVVEADPYKEADAPGGNTQRADGSGTFWGTTSNSATDDLWHERTYSSFATPYHSIPGVTNRVYEITGSDEDTFNGGAPALRTTVSGLPVDDYEVFLLYTTRHDGNVADAATYASLNAPVTAASTLYDHANDVETLTGTSVWDASLASLGTVDDATGFFVEVAGAAAPHNRAHFIGVGYRIVPEPNSIFLLGIAATAGFLFNRRRHRLKTFREC